MGKGKGKGAEKVGVGAKKQAGKPAQAPKEQMASNGKPAQPAKAKRKDLTVQCPDPKAILLTRHAPRMSCIEQRLHGLAARLACVSRSGSCTIPTAPCLVVAGLGLGEGPSVCQLSRTAHRMITRVAMTRHAQADRSLESLRKELLEQRLLVKTPEVHFRDFLAAHSYSQRGQKAGDIDAEPSLLAIRNRLIELCVLPLVSALVRER